LGRLSFFLRFRFPIKRLVWPITREKWIVRLQRPSAAANRPGVGVAGESLFVELVSFPELAAHPHFSLGVLLTQEEEILRRAGRNQCA
jgi:hypothetical protein